MSTTPYAPGRARAPVALLIALACARLAQWLFTGEVLTHYQDSQTWAWRPEFTAGTALLVVAAAAAALVGRQRPEPSGRVAPPARWRDLLALAPSLLLYLVGVGAYLSAGQTLLVDTVWGASIVALPLPLAIRWLRRRGLTGRRAGVGLATGLEWGAVALLTALAFWLRYWNLEDIPSHVDEDVALMGVHALTLVERGDYRW